MSQHIYKFLLSASLLMAFSSLWAQEEKEQEKPNQFTIDAQLMSRGEIRRGGMPGGTEDKDENKSNFVFNRNRLSVGYEREHLSVKMPSPLRGTLGRSLRAPAEGEGHEGVPPPPEKDLKSPSSTRLEALFPSRDSRAMTRSPSPPHGDLTSLAPHERLPEILVVPREKTPMGTAARGNP